MKNKKLIIGTSIIASYGLLKTSQSRIDPYTRTFVGVSIGVGMLFSLNPIVRFIGIGIGISSLLQMIDVKKGGRLIINKSNKPTFVLKENGGIVELNNNEIPDYNIDGFTIKGLKGVFKLSDGVYGKISVNNSVGTAFGVGSFVNQVRGAGFKNSAWCNKISKQGDSRWLELLNKSF